MADKKNPKPGLWLILRIWGGIGLQSFGGGASTLYLIQREFVEKRGWLEKDEFARYWNLCIMTPGINLLALTVLIGRKLGGGLGIAASLTGLLLPSATITCLLTAGLVSVQTMPAVQALLRGVIPATAGIMLVVGLNFAQPLLKQGREEGKIRLSASLVIIVATVLALILFKITVVLVLLCAAIAGMGIFTVTPGPQSPQASENQGEEE